MLKYTTRLSHYCSYTFRSTWTIIREPMPNLAKVTILPQQCWTFNDVFYWLFPQNRNFSKVWHRLPDDGPGGQKHEQSW